MVNQVKLLLMRVSSRSALIPNRCMDRPALPSIRGPIWRKFSPGSGLKFAFASSDRVMDTLGPPSA